MTDWPASEGKPRLVVDSRGVEWEVYDDSAWTLELALEWEFLPQPDTPGLIFTSAVDRRRLWPCPSDWADMSDEQVLELLDVARSVH